MDAGSGMYMLWCDKSFFPATLDSPYVVIIPFPVRTESYFNSNFSACGSPPIAVSQV